MGLTAKKVYGVLEPIINELNSDLTGLSIPVVDLSTSTDTIFYLEPNKKYLLGTRTTVSFVLMTPQDLTVENIYNFVVTAGTAFVPSFSFENIEKTVSINAPSSYTVNKVYRVFASYPDNGLVIRGW